MGGSRDDINKARTLVMGDPHGAYPALVQVLERAKFNPDVDTLIVLGDICDGWPDTDKCIDHIMHFPRLEYIMGNHDEWALDWMLHGRMSSSFWDWYPQGGKATYSAYGGDHKKVPPSHIEFLKNAAYYIKLGNTVFVHGGLLHGSIIATSPEYMTWDRSLWNTAKAMAKTDPFMKAHEYDHVYIGHTSCYADSKVPMTCAGVTNMDTGAGWNGVLSVMDIDTKEVWQSDIVKTLYPPGTHGR